MTIQSEFTHPESTFFTEKDWKIEKREDQKNLTTFEMMSHLKFQVDIKKKSPLAIRPPKFVTLVTNKVSMLLSNILSCLLSYHLSYQQSYYVTGWFTKLLTKLLTKLVSVTKLLTKLLSY